MNLTLTLPNGQPGRDAYEILAFFAQSASLALGTKDVTYFDSNVDVEAFGMLGGSDIRANHSYQFNHDAAETWEYYSTLKAEMGFGATHGAGAGAGSLVVASLPPVRLADDKTVTETENDLNINLHWLLSSNGWAAGAVPIAAREQFFGAPAITRQSADLALLDLLGNRTSQQKELAWEIPFSNDRSAQTDGRVAIDDFFSVLDDSLLSLQT